MGENEQLLEIYSELKNPIENPETIVRLLDDYSKSKEGEFYDRIMASKDKEYSNQEYTVGDLDNFYSTLYNVWKKSVEDMTWDQFRELGIYQNDFLPFRNHLKELPDFESVSEINELLRVDEKNKTADENGFARVFDKYRWSYDTNPKTGMIRITSKDLHANKPEVAEGPHRLYLNPESVDLYTLLTEFIKECEARNLPYDLEYNSNSKTDMPILIKATDDTIKDYIDTLKVINDRYPAMKSRMKKPPIVTGSIDGWIGYAYELENEYTKSRADFIENCIKEYTLEWVLKHKDINLDNGEEAIKLIDYISLLCTNEIISEMEFSSNIEESKERILNYVTNKMEEFLTSIANKKETSPVMVEKTDYQDAILDAALINRVLRESAYDFSKMDSNFTKELKDKILIKALDFDIDPNKFCVDFDPKQLFVETEKVEPEEIDELDLDEPFDLEDIKYENPLPMDDEKVLSIGQKPTLTNPSEIAEIIDFEDLGEHANEVELFNQVDANDLSYKIKYETITDTSTKDIYNKLSIPSEEIKDNIKWETVEDAADERHKELNLDKKEISDKIKWETLEESKEPKKSILRTIYEEITEEVPETEEEKTSSLISTIDKLFEETEKEEPEVKIPEQKIEIDEDIKIPESKEEPKTVLELVMEERSREPEVSNDLDSLMEEAKQIEPEVETTEQEIEEEIKIPEPEKEEPKTVLELILDERSKESEEKNDIDKLMEESKPEEQEEIKIPEEPKVEQTETVPEPKSNDSITIVDFEVTLPNGSTMTIGDYYNNYYKINKPLNASVSLTDGKAMPARDFMQYIVLPSIGTDTLDKTTSKARKM